MIRLAVLLAALLCAGCGPTAIQTQATAANTIARAANASTASLAETYTLRGEALIDGSSSRNEALALLQAHREQWRPVWAAIDALASAHDLWATSLESGIGSAEAAAALMAAWCDLAEAVRAVGERVPAIVRCGR